MKKGLCIGFLLLFTASMLPGCTDSPNTSATTSSVSSGGVSSPQISSQAATSTTERKPVPMDTKDDLGVTDEMLQKAIFSEGNRARLKAVMEKADRGEEITIGFLGGSITDGSNVPTGKSYASLVNQWWLNTFPKTNIKYVNAGIGSTGSIIGVHRADKDLLSHNPDFVILEYAVNDGTDTETKEAYESLVRKILNAPSHPALVLLFMCTSGGGGAQDTHAEVGAHYNLPMISYRDACRAAVGADLFSWSKVTTDTVHPNEYGYAVCGLFINTYLTGVHDNLDSIADKDEELPSPMTGDIYRNTKILTSLDAAPISLGSAQATADALPFCKNGWEIKGQEPLVFEVEAKRVTLLYRRDKSIARGTVLVTADDEPMCYLKGNYEQGWDYLPSSKVVFNADAARKVSISIALDEGETNGFVLAAVYLAY